MTAGTDHHVWMLCRFGDLTCWPVWREIWLGPDSCGLGLVGQERQLPSVFFAQRMLPEWAAWNPVFAHQAAQACAYVLRCMVLVGFVGGVESADKVFTTFSVRT